MDLFLNDITKETLFNIYYVFKLTIRFELI